MTVSLLDVAGKSFDYIVIGGGTAGLTLAVRLSEDPDKTVCVLEAGDANLNDPALLTPASFTKHFGDKKYDWGHFTAKQKLSGDRAFHWARGRGLGGSSGINFLVWTKPSADEIDDIERLGNPGWNWKNYDKYARKVERFVEPTSEQKQRFPDLPVYEDDISRDGAIPIAFPKTLSDVQRIGMETFENAHIPSAPRPYGGQPTGRFWAPANIDTRTSTRAYAVTAYYLPNKDRPNLTVLVRALATRVLTDAGPDGKLLATGVEFIHEDQAYKVHAKREVILSAGSVKSPQLLELSGIGRRDVLERAGIPVKVELPGVGENLQEHCVGAVVFELKDGYEAPTLDVLKSPKSLPEQLELYKRGEGAFTMAVCTFAFLPLEIVSPRHEQIFAKAKAEVDQLARQGLAPGLAEQYAIQLERLKPGSGRPGPGCELIFIPGSFGPTVPEEGKKYISYHYVTHHNLSRGSLHITSSDPTQDPDIDARYFQFETDADVFLETVKLACKLAREVSPLKDIVERGVVPGPEVQTDEQLLENMKEHYSTAWHTCGTCSMLPKDKGGVVDPTLKVYSTHNLRVVDLSVIPLHFASHTQATVYVIAEQAADIIKGTFVA